MENASKALLIAGGILISMLVIAIGVYLFINYVGISSSYEQTMQSSDIREFNVNFTKFEGRTDVTIQEIVTLANFAKQCEEKTGIHIKVNVYAEGDLTTKDDAISLIQDNSTDNQGKNKYFECIDIADNDEDGKIDSINFVETE